MSIPVHTVQVLDPQPGNDFYDRVIVAQKVGVAVTNGTNPTLAVTFSEGLPQVNGVWVSVNTASLTYFITAKTASGFTINFTGTASSTTADILVVAA